MSSWDDDLPEWEDTTTRRKGSPEQAEMRWIMMVVGRSLGAGVAILVVWLVISAVWKSLSPTKITPSVLPTESVDHPAVTPQPSVTPRPVTPPKAVETVRPVPIPKEKSIPSKPSEETTETPETAMTDEIAMTEKGEESQKNDSPFKPVGKGKPTKVEPKESNPEESVSDSNDSMPESGSPAIRAAHDSVYAIIMESADKTRSIQIGTAWAVSRRYLVTTATIVTAIEDHQQQGMIASVVHFATEKSFRIKSKRIHDSHTKAVEAAEDARERKDEKRYAKERAIQLRFDLGVLDVGRNERLVHQLSIDSDPIETKKDAYFMMVGLPFPERDESPDSTSLDSSSLKERRSKKPVAGTPIQDKQLGLNIQFPIDTKGNNWSGSPVLNKDEKVIGVYSQLIMPTPVAGKPVKPIHGVAWIGRLDELVSDIE